MVSRAFLFLLFGSLQLAAQLPVARDTIPVIESGHVLKMPWANGINFSNVSSIDLNGDNKKDLVVFDRINQFGTGRFRCFIKQGNAGQASYVADPQLSYHFPQVSGWGVLHDYDCDGREDLFCSTSAGIKVYRNTSAGNFLAFTLAKPLLYSDYDPTAAIYTANLYASSVGVPGIKDVDGDGDLDILTFAVGGYYVQFHKNLSMEKYNHCDSLEFEIADLCWGQIYESNCSVTMGIDCVQKPPKDTSGYGQRTYHAGSCLMCFDSDNDGDQDMIMGDIACNTVQYVHNTGTNTFATFSDTTTLYPNYPALSNTTRIRVNNFPCTYNVDVDGDQVFDLIASPNAFGSENYKSLWYYRNTSLTGTVNFQFVKNNFLQDEMIEVGQGSFPVLFDHNADGKKDLLIGNYGYYNNNSLDARLTLYENIGSASAPVFSLITRDYASLGAQNLNNIMPAVGDIDNDGDVDICIGTGSGQVHWLQNTAGPGSTATFSFLSNPFTFTTNSAAAAPQLYDLNKDGKLDLLIGTKNGRISYYQNTGTSSPAFSLVTNFLGGVDVKGSPNLYGLDGYAVPYFYDENGSVNCMVGSVSGAIFQYQVSSAINAPFTLLSSSVSGLNEGGQSAVWYEDINDDGKRDLFLGNGSGGLSFFSSASPFVGMDEIQQSDRQLPGFYPNPASAELRFSAEHANQFIDVEITDLTGRVIIKQQRLHAGAVLGISHLSEGIYLIKVNGAQSDNFYVRKFIKE